MLKSGEGRQVKRKRRELERREVEKEIESEEK